MVNMIHSILYIFLAVLLVNGSPNLGGWYSFTSDTDHERLDHENDHELPKEQLHRLANDSNENIKFINSDDSLPIGDLLREVKKKPKRSLSREKQENKIENPEDSFSIEDLRHKIEKNSREKSENKEEEEMQVVNPHDPLPIEDLLEEIEKSEGNDTAENKEMMGILEQLENVVTDNTKTQANILIKGFWHVVDLGIPGSKRREAAKEQTLTLFDRFLRILRNVYEWFWGCFGYDMKEKEEKNENDGDDTKKEGEEKDDDSDTATKGKLKTVGKDGKPLAGTGDGKVGATDPKNKDPKTHTASNGRLVYDGDWKDSKELEKAMKSLNDLSVLLDGKLKTREEVDKELKEAQDNKDVNNRFYKQSEKFKTYREEAKDPRVWTEEEALKKLKEMDEAFDKTTDKKEMVKDILSLSLQPLYYVETYDEIMKMIDRLKKSGVPEKDLVDAEDSAYENILFSLTHLIQKTPRDVYLQEKHAAHEKISEEEKQKHGYPEKLTEEAVLTKLGEMEKNFATADKPAMVKDVTTMSMQPFLHIDTYDRIFDVIKKLVEAKVPETDLKLAHDAIKRESRFVIMENLLKRTVVSDQELYKIQVEKAKQKREKIKDPREFTEEQATQRIEEMKTNFDSTGKDVMVKDVTNLSMQPLYHVETYDKLDQFIDDMKKKKGATEEELKPAVESLKEEKEFALEHDLQRTRQGSIANQLHDMKLRYVKQVALTTAEKHNLLKELEILKGRQDLTADEVKSSRKLIQLLKGDDFEGERDKVGPIYNTIMENAKRYPAGKTQINPGNWVTNVNPNDFVLGKVVDGKVVKA
ncbi:uncharacterized protein LOC135844120 isoform X2 [Planococcus citri]|uniref:uncharacterized protein LOC135844120 isoform X2 n=1 Tax=Planococcus citri TaxID=170843 RepID=UPI0031F8B840